MHFVGLLAKVFYVRWWNKTLESLTDLKCRNFFFLQKFSFFFSWLWRDEVSPAVINRNIWFVHLSGWRYPPGFCNSSQRLGHSVPLLMSKSNPVLFIGERLRAAKHSPWENDPWSRRAPQAPLQHNPLLPLSHHCLFIITPVFSPLVTSYWNSSSASARLCSPT